MKKIILSLISLAILGLAVVEAAKLTVKLENVAPEQGIIDIHLFADETSWLNESVQAFQVAADSSEIIVVFENVEPGEYAVSATHDVDENGALNSGAFGKPTEPYGFSNNARGMFGPAKWQKAKFTVNEGSSETSIKLK
jgi:uncharacterized protein (DUF2141 family)